MKTSVVLKQERAAKFKAQKDLRDKVIGEKREKMTEEETTQFRALGAEIGVLDGEIADAEQFEETQRKLAETSPSALPVSTETGGSEQREKRKIFGEFRIGQAISMVADKRELSGAIKEVHEIAIEEARNLGLSIEKNGINIPASMMRANSHTVSEDSGNYGGKLVKESAGEMLVDFVPRLTVEDLGVKVLMGLTDDYPLLSGGDFVFENVTETGALTAQKKEYEKRVLKPKRTGCLALISNQLLIQSSIDVENDIRSRIGQALNRRIFLDLINGSGTGANPLGLLNDDIFESAIAQGVLTRAKALELQSEVESAESTTERLAYLMHTKLFYAGQQIALDSGSGLFLVDANGRLANADTKRTSLVPTLVGTADATCYPLIYGDWDAARVGFWGGMNIQADPYTNAHTNELRLIINVHRDCMASNPKAFAVNKAITLS